MDPLIGVTGPPGSGKSTLVAALVAEVRATGRAVAVLAIDPSSPVTGGAILGDRIRMQQYAADPDVFIRSMASRGHLGGLAGTTAEAAAALAACGFDLVFIETVGTGQSEVEVAAIADTTVVVQAPEMGDEVQALKAGLLEVADIVVVNKSDRPGADRAAAQLRAMLTMGADQEPGHGEGQVVTLMSDSRRPRPKRPSVLLASGLTSAGVPELLAALDITTPAGRRPLSPMPPGWPGHAPRWRASSPSGCARPSGPRAAAPPPTPWWHASPRTRSIPTRPPTTSWRHWRGTPDGVWYPT